MVRIPVLPVTVIALMVQGCAARIDEEVPLAAKPDATASPSQGRAVEVENDSYTFVYSYPPEALRIAGLRSLLDDRLTKARGEIAAQSAEAQEDARTHGYPFRPHYLAIGWRRVADVSGWLSLAATIETYSGGAHGNQGYDALFWDKNAGVPRKAADLFVSPETLRSAIRERFCLQLAEERMAKRGEVLTGPGDDDPFTSCIDPLDATITLESGNDALFDTVTVLIAPYLAGPYAEGSYIVSVPVDAAVVAAAKPQYRAAFTADR